MRDRQAACSGKSRIIRHSNDIRLFNNRMAGICASIRLLKNSTR